MMGMNKYQFWKSGHPLVYSNLSINYIGGDYLWDNCRWTGFCQNGRYSCAPCKFDIWMNCYNNGYLNQQIPQQGFIPPTMMAANIYAWMMNHPLVMWYTAVGYSGGVFVCNRWAKKIPWD